ncbi:MAG: class I SAM-dependent methyltransferase [Paracoccaceae bacterium]
MRSLRRNSAATEKQDRKGREIMPSTEDYDNHPGIWRNHVEALDEAAQAMRLDTLDGWRHIRMIKPASSLIKRDPNASWLTVGDGHFGRDGHILTQLGATSVHATDFSSPLLEIGKDRGFIGSCSLENAEALSFADNGFDFVLCKEAYHHFPRPYIALYEMLRVAKKGVILVEPRDENIDRGMKSATKFILRTLRRKRVMPHYFEEVGNYVYTVSERELEKFMLGMHRTSLAFLPLNDHFTEGLGEASMPPKSDGEKTLFKQMSDEIAKRDRQEKRRIRRSSHLVAILFKEPPASEMIKSLTDEGFRFALLPENPYR